MMRTFFAGVIIGSLTMYLLDPDNGRKRRFVAKDKYNKVKDYTKMKAADFKHQAGVVHAETDRMLQ